jgi:AraC-like DNA-binding protein
MESIQPTLWAILYAAAALQGLFVAGILFHTLKGNSRANKLLAILILAFSYTRFLAFVNLSEIYRDWPHLLATGAPLWFIFAPLYYFYVKALLAQPVQWNRFSVFHVLPALAVLFYKLPFYMMPGESKVNMMVAPDQSDVARLTMLFFSALYGLQNLVYLRLCIKNLQRQKQNSNGAAMTAKPAYLSWLKFLFTLMILFAGFHLTVAALEFSTNSDLVKMDYLPMAFFTVMVYAIAYLAIQQPEKLFPLKLRIRKAFLPYEADQINSRQIIRNLQRMMEAEKPYRNSNLKYSDLAAKLDISVRLLSRILNEELGQGFNDFINAYRVQEVKDHLLGKENSEHTLLAIALDAGFNSKTSFNRIFKNHTGMTPTEFIRRHKAGQAHQ